MTFCTAFGKSWCRFAKALSALNCLMEKFLIFLLKTAGILPISFPPSTAPAPSNHAPQVKQNKLTKYLQTIFTQVGVLYA